MFRFAPGQCCQTLCHIPQVFFVALIIFSVLASSCSTQTSPESVVSEFLDKAEAAIEDRNVRELRKLVAKNYFDPLNRTHNDIVGLGTAYLLRTRSIHLFTDLASAVMVDDQVEARVLAAFVAREVTDRKMLLQMDGDIYWFDLVLKDEGDGWQVISATWRQAMLDDLLGR